MLVDQLGVMLHGSFEHALQAYAGARETGQMG